MSIYYCEVDPGGRLTVVKDHTLRIGVCSLGMTGVAEVRFTREKAARFAREILDWAEGEPPQTVSLKKLIAEFEAEQAERSLPDDPPGFREAFETYHRRTLEGVVARPASAHGPTAMWLTTYQEVLRRALRGFDPGAAARWSWAIRWWTRKISPPASRWRGVRATAARAARAASGGSESSGGAPIESMRSRSVRASAFSGIGSSWQ